MASLTFAALVGLTSSCEPVNEGSGSSADTGPAPTEAQAAPGAARSPAIPLEEESVVLVPDTTEETAWLGQVTKLLADAEAGTFLALQTNQGDAVEFTVEGDLLTRFGGQRGQGPGEVARLVDVAVSATAVALLDQGNRRVLVFDRSGSLDAEFPISSGHRALAWLGESLLLLPGQESSALDVLSVATGVLIGSLGRWEALPVRCDDEASLCRMEASLCRGCEVAITSDRIVLFNKDQAILTALTLDGEIAWRRDYQRDDPLVSSWVEADEPIRERMEREEAARAPSGVARTEVIKSYFLDVEASDDDHLTVAVVPSADEFRRRGFEVWRIDARDGSYERYGYPRPGVGFLVAGRPTDLVLALEPATGGLFSFRSGRR